MTYFITYTRLFNSAMITNTLFFMDEKTYKRELRKWKRSEGDLLFTKILNHGLKEN